MFKFIAYISIIFSQSILFAAPAIDNFEMPAHDQPDYRSLTMRFVEYYNYESILATLRDKGMSLEHRNFFEHVIPHEELGFFGYHSSTQGFRIFQDIIRMVLEEILELEIKKDFHFLSANLFTKSPQSLEELSHLFVKEGYQLQLLESSTFPLKGMNCVRAYCKLGTTKRSNV